MKLAWMYLTGNHDYYMSLDRDSEGKRIRYLLRARDRWSGSFGYPEDFGRFLVLDD